MNMNMTIYHNPACGTSRAALAAIRAAGIEPLVVEYLTTPLTRAQLVALVAATGQPVRAIVRSKETLYAELGLANAPDDALLDAMVVHPILMNRPVVASGGVARLCRPAELVLSLLPKPG